MKSDNRIKKFFEGVEQASKTLDLSLIDSQFADQFIFAGPNGTWVVEKQKFLAFLPQRQEFFKPIGHQSTKVLSLDEIRLDDQYTMVKAHFLMQFKKASGELAEAMVDSTYFLFMKGDSPKILMHMEHEDVREAMQARSVLPPGEWVGYTLQKFQNFRSLFYNPDNYELEKI